MNMKNLIFILVLVLLIPLTALAQGTGFNFQGRLNDGTSPANGRYDMGFRLYDAIVGGNQTGASIFQTATLVNGVFSVTLDFGFVPLIYSNGAFIEVLIRPNGSPNAFTVLGPRQQLTIVPFAVRATNADTATNAVNAQNAVTATNAATATNALNLGGLAPSNYAQLNVVNNGDLRTNGALAITSNAFQPITANGFVKAMLYVQQDGLMLRCYNGITPSQPAGNCGFTILHSGPPTGVYHVIFNFRVDDRFLVVTARNPTVVSTFVAASFQFVPGNPNAVDVITFITNAGTLGGDEANFMLVVY
jgi:hypothetical protein